MIEELRHQNIGRLLVEASRAYRRGAMAEISRRGHPALTLAHAAILPFIDPGGVRLSELAEQTGMTKQSAAQLVQQLISAGYLRKTEDPTDGRAQLITFTEEGMRFVRDAHEIRLLLEEKMEQAIGRAELNALRDQLRRLPEHLLSK
jgi:DNA-binding MarR family transcriptional regulator